MPLGIRTASETSQSREFAFSQGDFQRVCDLLYRHSGIALAAHKDQLVYSRLARRLRVLKLRSFAEYLARVESDEAEWQQFLNALTTNLTSFFREAHHFEQLREFLQQRSQRGQQRLWCAASSTGEEPYSLVMTAMEAFGSFQPPFELLASDIDTHVLDKARAGIYAADVVQKLGAERHRFFLRGKGDKANMAKVRPELQALIDFQQINLLAANWPVHGPLDAIFCRNVMIYFDKPTQQKILQRFAPLLQPDGLLFVGHSENITFLTDLFEPIGRTVYRLRKRG